jgi:transcriptional regulator with XRE-family HTH domain
VTGHRLDVPELHRLLNAQRQERGLTWRGVGRETGLLPSTIARICAGHPPSADALVSLIVWLDLDTDIARLVQPRETP